jgi:hypothetical protein
VNAQGMHSHPPRSMPLPATVAAGGGGGGSGYAGTPVLQLQSLAAVPATMNAQLYASSSRIPPPSPSWGVGNVGLLPSPRSLELGREDQADLFTISPENYAAFSGMFDSVDVNGSGFLSGAQARPVLTNSGLPTSDLRKIWDLADAEKDGMLDRHEYIICQFLIKHRLAGHELPTTLPAALQPKTLSSRMQGKGGGGGRGGLSVVGGAAAAMYSAPPSPVPSVHSQRAASPPPPSVMRQSLTVIPNLASMSVEGSHGSARASPSVSAMRNEHPHAAMPPSPMSKPMPLPSTRSTLPSYAAQDELEQWKLADYVRFAEDFSDLDSDGDGYISGMEARPVLMRSGLGTGDLRKIWDLSDLTSDGLLDRHEYVVAMVLVQACQQGVPLPDTLPAYLKTRPEFGANSSPDLSSGVQEGSQQQDMPDTMSVMSVMSRVSSASSVSSVGHAFQSHEQSPTTNSVASPGLTGGGHRVTQVSC